MNGEKFVVGEIRTVKNAEHELFVQVWEADRRRFLELIRFYEEDEASLHYGESKTSFRFLVRFHDLDLRQVRAQDGAWQVGYAMPE